jgi:hypothetical protein
MHYCFVETNVCIDSLNMKYYELKVNDDGN